MLAICASSVPGCNLKFRIDALGSTGQQAKPTGRQSENPECPFGKTPEARGSVYVEASICSARLRSTALVATMMDDADINSADHSGRTTIRNDG